MRCYWCPDGGETIPCKVVGAPTADASMVVKQPYFWTGGSLKYLCRLCPAKDATFQTHRRKYPCCVNIEELWHVDWTHVDLVRALVRYMQISVDHTGRPIEPGEMLQIASILEEGFVSQKYDIPLPYEQFITGAIGWLYYWGSLGVPMTQGLIAGKSPLETLQPH